LKYLLLLTIFTFSSIIYACPNLVGAYRCKHLVRGYEIGQKVKNNVWQFQINGQKYLADDISHPLTRSDVTGTYTSRCIGKSNLSLLSRIYQQ